MFSRSAWMTLLSAGPATVLKLGSSGEDVRRVQRALNAASPRAQLAISGSYDAATQAAVMRWQAKNGIAENGVVGLRRGPRCRRATGRRLTVDAAGNRSGQRGNGMVTDEIGVGRGFARRPRP